MTLDLRQPEHCARAVDGMDYVFLCAAHTSGAAVIRTSPLVHITPNVLASCDEVAATRAQAFGGSSAMIDNFLAVPGSAVYEQMRSGAWEYRILRAGRR